MSRVSFAHGCIIISAWVYFLHSFVPSILMQFKIHWSIRWIGADALQAPNIFMNCCSIFFFLLYNVLDNHSRINYMPKFWYLKRNSHNSTNRSIYHYAHICFVVTITTKWKLNKPIGWIWVIAIKIQSSYFPASGLDMCGECLGVFG